MSTRTILKGFFETGDKPTQLQFADLIDSLFHKTEDSLPWASLSGVPATFAPSAHTHAYADLTGKPTLFSGAYSDLTGKPTLFSGAYADLSGKPALFSGAYSALTGIPSTFAPSAHSHVAGEITGGLFHPSRMGAGVTTDGYMIQMVAGVPTWVVAPTGGGSGISGLTTGKIPKATSATTIGNSLLSDDGSYVMVNTISTFGGGRGNLLVNHGVAAINPSDPNSGVSLTSEASYDQLQSYSGRNIVMNPAGNNVGIGANPNTGIRLHVHGNAFFGEAHAGSNGWIFGGYNNNNGGFLSTILGGREAQTAAPYCITLGSTVRALHEGTFILGDQFDAPLMSTVAINEFRARYRGGFTFHTDINGSNNAFRIMTDGSLRAALMPIFANEAAAVAGGVASNTFYKTATGEVRIKL